MSSQYCQPTEAVDCSNPAVDHLISSSLSRPSRPITVPFHHPASSLLKSRFTWVRTSVCFHPTLSLFCFNLFSLSVLSFFFHCFLLLTWFGFYENLIYVLSHLISYLNITLL